MTQIVSLFNNQDEAGDAIKALSQADLGENDVRILDEWAEEFDKGVVDVSAYNPYAGASESAAVANLKTWTLNLTEAEKAFFGEAVKEGGALVVVEMPDDANISYAKKILEEQGGQVTEK